MKLLTNLTVLSNSSLIFVDAEDFPSNPVGGQLAFVDGILYIYTSIGGISTWYPLSKRSAYYIHTQDTSAITWTITHNLGTDDIIFMAYDESNVYQLPEIVSMTDTTLELGFTEATGGKAIIIAGMDTGGSDSSGQNPGGDTGNGSLNLNMKTISSDYVMTSDDSIIFVDTTNNDVYITTPPLSGSNQKMIYIKKIRDALEANNTIYIQTPGAEKIDGQDVLSFYELWAAFTLACNGENWYIM